MTAPAVPSAFRGAVVSQRIAAFVEREFDLAFSALRARYPTKVQREARAMYVWARRSFEQPRPSYAKIGRAIGGCTSEVTARADRHALAVRRDNAEFALSCDRLIASLLRDKEAFDGHARH